MAVAVDVAVGVAALAADLETGLDLLIADGKTEGTTALSAVSTINRYVG